MTRVRIVLTLALAGSVAPSVAVHAQNTPATTWVLDEARGGFCIWYLVEPEPAASMVGKAGTPRPATAVADLPPLLQRIIQDEPRFAGWTPAVLCIGRYASVQSDGEVLDRGRDDRPVVVTWQGVAVTEPHGIRGPGWLLEAVGGDAPRLERVAGQSGLLFRDRSLRNNRVKGSEGEDDWEIRVDGVKLFWTGHQTGDVRVGSTRMMSFGYAGGRTTTWMVELEQAPGSERSLVGTLRVEGKSDLAKALKASPVRAVSAAELGGRTTLTFRRPGR